MDGDPDRRETYLAYMLRLWQAGSRAGRPIWRASLENPHSGERHAFGDTAALFDFLTQQIESLHQQPAPAEKAAVQEAGGKPSEPPDLDRATQVD